MDPGKQPHEPRSRHPGSPSRPHHHSGTPFQTRLMRCERFSQEQIPGRLLHPLAPGTSPVTSARQHKPRLNPPICLFSVFIKEVENERKRLGEGGGMTKSLTCLFNFAAPSPYIPWGQGLQSELQIFTNSINRIQIVFKGESTTQTRVSPPCSQTPSPTTRTI